MKGWRTILLFLAQAGAFILGWEKITEYIDPQWIALIEAGLAIIMRYITTSPVGKKS